MALILGYVFVAIAVIVAFVISILIVKRLKDDHEKESLTTFLTILALALSLLVLLIVPIDIYSSKPSHNHDDSQVTNDVGTDPTNTLSTVIRYFYYVIFSVSILLMFIGLPFAYFYYEDYDEDSSRRSRAFLGLKVSILLVVVVGIMIIIGIFVRTGSSGGQKSAPQYVWYRAVRDACGVYPSGIGFVMGILIFLGYFVWMFYTAYGLSGLPIGLMAKKQRDTSELTEAQNRLEETRRKKLAITSRYASGAKVSKKDRESIALLSDEEKVYEQHTNRLLHEATGGRTAFTGVVGPLAIVLGVVFIVVSLFVVVSLLMTLIENVIYSYCGASCGYFFTLPHNNNPIDYLLILSSKYFPLDYVLVIIFIVYILGSTLTGICTFGARIFVFKKYVVETKRTRPVALVFGVGYLVFCSFCLALQLLTLFPRYAAFGSQTYTVQDNTGASVEHYCDFKADPSVCQLSQLATFFMFVFGTNQSFLGVIFYYVNWIFFVLWLVGIVLSVIMTVRRNKQDATLISSMEYDADIERQKTPINGGSNSKSKSKSNNNRSYGTKVDVA